MHQPKSILGRTVSATDVPCKAQVEALLAQVSSETGEDVPFETRIKNPDFTQAVEARLNAERLLSDTKHRERT